MNIKAYKKTDIFHRIIIAIVVLKIVAMGFFTSDYSKLMFMKFVMTFLTSFFSGTWLNPYEHFIGQNLFPYPPMMLAVESIGGACALVAGSSLFLQNLLFKLPNLFFDCMGCYFLTRMFPSKRRYVAVFYFASPIIFYSTYMHGQLDIIPTVFLVGALYYLTTQNYKNNWKFVLFMTCALTSKFHIIAVIPIIFLFIAKREGSWKAIKLIGEVGILSIVFILPFWGSGFIQGVLKNTEQSGLFKVIIDYKDVYLYIPILAVGLIYLKAFDIKSINKDLLYSLCGVLFAIFLILVPPMPGWYVWVVPFVAIFFIELQADKYQTAIIYVLLNLIYLLYFVFAHKTSHTDLYFLDSSLACLKYDNPILANILFTSLTCFLVYCTYLMYQGGVVSNAIYKRKNQPFIIGIAGDSGSGKSTLIELIKQIVGEKNLLYIEGDGDHKWARGNAMWTHFTHLNPKANFLYRQAEDIAILRTGQNVRRIDYDHSEGEFTVKKNIKPKPYILLCGLHALYLPQIRNNLDLKIYMDIDETLRRYWKIQRDVLERGYSKETILKQLEARMADAQKYVYPQRQYADLKITYFDSALTNCLIDEYKIQLGLKLTISAAINLDKLIDLVERYDIQVQYDYNENLKSQTIIFTGEELQKRTLPINTIIPEFIPHIDEIIHNLPEAENNLIGILELVLLLLISYKMMGGEY